MAKRCHLDASRVQAFAQGSGAGGSAGRIAVDAERIGVKGHWSAADAGDVLFAHNTERLSEVVCWLGDQRISIPPVAQAPISFVGAISKGLGSNL
jgi:hypothetical protein